MYEIIVKDIINICNAELICGNEEESLENFKKDTREIANGDTYVGMQGENVNRKHIFRECI